MLIRYLKLIALGILLGTHGSSKASEKISSDEMSFGVVNNQPSAPVKAALVMSGTYTIDPGLPAGGNNFQTLNAAVDSLQIAQIAGDVTFILADTIFNEQISIGTLTGLTMSDWVEFTSDTSLPMPIIEFAPGSSTSNYVIELDDTERIRFSNLHIRSLSTQFGRAVHITGTSSDIRIENNTIEAIPHLSSSSANTMDIETSGLGIEIKNNHISGGYRGLWCRQTGFPFGFQVTSVIDSNTVTDFYRAGIRLEDQNNCRVSHNNVVISITTAPPGLAPSLGIYGILILHSELMEVMKNQVSGDCERFGAVGVGLGNIKGFWVSENGVDLKGRRLIGMSIGGFEKSGVNRSRVSNNMISCQPDSIILPSPLSYGGFQCKGLQLIPSSWQSDADVVYNSVLISGFAPASAALSLDTDLNSSIHLFNNSFTNLAAGYAVEFQAIVGELLSNNNNLYSNGTNLIIDTHNPNYFHRYRNREPLRSYPFEIDTNSISRNPVHFSNSDLHVLGNALNSAGEALCWRKL